MPQVTTQKTATGYQYRITIPYNLIKALDIHKGDQFTFIINGKGRLELIKED